MPMYSSPFQWLVKNVGNWDRVKLICEFLQLASLVSSEDLLERYQKEMAKGGISS